MSFPTTYAAPRSWAEKAYPNLIQFNRLDKGGHFAAWEQTEAFVQELRTAFSRCVKLIATKGTKPVCFVLGLLWQQHSIKGKTRDESCADK